MSGTFEIYTDKAGEFRFRLNAGNGQTILSSEHYKAKDSALKGIDSVRRNAARAGAFEPLTAKDGRPYFVLKATNGQVVGQSQMYASAASCNQGIESVQKYAPEAQLVDETLG